jgi:DNA-binding LacI/PurR family transcriptional regulator
VAALQTSSLRDIARAAGVSAVSVSRALRNQTGISEVTRRKILEIAQRQDYRPNPFVSTLMAHVRLQRPVTSAAAIAYIVPSMREFRSAFGYQKYFAGAAQRAGRLGYKVELFSFEEYEQNPRRLSGVLYSRGIRGVLLTAFPFSSPVFDIEWSRFCSATVGYTSAHPALHRASCDHFHAMQLAFTKLLAARYTRIGFYTLQIIDDWTQHHWTSAFLYNQQQGRTRERVPVLLTEKLDEQAFKRWFLHHAPDAIITKHIQVLDWLKALGAQSPHVGLVHLDWIPEFGNVAGINQNSKLVAAAAVDLIVEQFHWNEGGVPPHPKAALIQNEWVDGRTVRATRRAER